MKMVKNTVYQTKSRWKTVLVEYLMLSLGMTLVTVGLYVFPMPNKFLMGGVNGISIVLVELLPADFPITAGGFVAILNMLLLLVGFAFLGREFGFKTVYTSIYLSALGMLIEWMGNHLGENGPLFPLTDNLLLELALAVIFQAVGTAIVFYYNASGGGTDIVAMVLKKYTRVEGGKALLCVDFVIMLVSFTYGIELGLLSALGLFAKAMIVDKVNRNLNLSKYCIIVTTFPEEIGEYINRRLHRGATMWKGVGVYTHEDKYILLVVMNARQATVVRDEIKRIDEHAFIVVDDTSDIVGNGFRALI